MPAPRPIYVRLFQVQTVFGVHPDTVRRWSEAGRVAIHRRGRCAFVRTEDMEQAIEGLGEQLGEPDWPSEKSYAK